MSSEEARARLGDAGIEPELLWMGTSTALATPTRRFASPSDTPFEERAIPPSSVGQEYTRWQVVRELPPSVQEGEIAKWFEQPGGGIQYRFDRDITWYEREGYLEGVD